MSVDAVAPGNLAFRRPPLRLTAATGLALTLAYLIVLAAAFWSGAFLLDLRGAPIANDFVNVWAAGSLTLNGHAVDAYDWSLHKAAEVTAVGHDFANYYGWHYPPTFLFVAAALAAAPYLLALTLWLAATLAGYVGALWAILGRSGALLALGFPATLWNVAAGQNGFLTAALIGGMLTLLDRRPVLAGICLGALTYKPQFGLLFPVVLAADRRWTTLATAAAVAAALAVASWLAFGATSWEAFFHGMSQTSREVLGRGAADWDRLQSLFGFMRAHGATETAAWSAQIAVALVVAAASAAAWRSTAPFELKAAMLAAGALLVTPYLYIYDTVVLAVACAYLLRSAVDREAAALETAAVVGAGALILIFPYVKSQVGPVAALILFAVAAYRCMLHCNRRRAAVVEGGATAPAETGGNDQRARWAESRTGKNRTETSHIPSRRPA